MTLMVWINQFGTLDLMSVTVQIRTVQIRTVIMDDIVIYGCYDYDILYN